MILTVCGHFYLWAFIYEPSISSASFLSDLACITSLKDKAFVCSCNQIYQNQINLFILKVTVLQEYFNSSDEAIEAKFVFPLTEMAAVCGFEAYINDKHIVGQVSNKLQTWTQ